MPQDLAQLTKKLAPSYHSSFAPPSSLEASWETVRQAEERIYGICERKGIILDEDALPLREEVALPVAEAAPLPERNYSTARPFVLPTAYLSANAFVLAGIYGPFQTAKMFLFYGHSNAALVSGVLGLLMGASGAIGLVWLGYYLREKLTTPTTSTLP